MVCRYGVFRDSNRMGRDDIILDTFYIFEWKVTIIYQYNDIEEIIDILKNINCPKKFLIQAEENLESDFLNKGITYSNVNMKSSVIVIGDSKSFSQKLNTIAHEYYHLVSHISQILDIKEEERLANLMGNLVMKSFEKIYSLFKVGFI